MEFKNTYYKVVIENVTGASPKDGFVDPTTLEAYFTEDDTKVLTDVNLILAKERANVRWKAILMNLGTTIGPFVSNIIVNGGDYDTEPTSVELTVGYDRIDYLNTEDEQNQGVRLIGAESIKRFVARALSNDFNTRREIPFTQTSPVVYYDKLVEDIFVGAIGDIPTVEAKISVELVEEV